MARSGKKAAQPLSPRRAALEGRVASHRWASVTPAAPVRRLALRAPQESLAALSRALGLALPERPATSALAGARAALWLGPDEWLVIEEGEGDPAAALSGVKAFHSAVDVSHRDVGILVSGRGAEAALAAGCPRDLSAPAFPVGACARTVLGKAEVTVWRTAEEAFRVECRRSFGDYVFSFLAEAARDAAI